MNGGINPAEPTAENDDSLLARHVSYRIGHRIVSEAKLPVRIAI
jgi:hypothetical protein